MEAFNEFARRQSAMYRGGDTEAVRERLTPDVVWHVPGSSAIAGDHRGRDAVMAYFERRRALAGGAMTIIPGERLVAGDTVIQVADGEMEHAGERLRWRTAGVYRFEGDRVAEAWLVPLELAAFDRIWTTHVSGASRLETPRGMEIPKEKILELIRERAGGQQADQAANELPDQVDPSQHSDLLAKFGINPQDLLSGGLGDIGGKLGL